MPAGQVGPVEPGYRTGAEFSDLLNFLFTPTGPIQAYEKYTSDIIPGWFNDTNIFLGLTGLGVIALTGGSAVALAKPKKRARTRRKAPRREKRPKTDYYDLLSRFLDKAQPTVSRGLTSLAASTAIALPFVHSYIQGAENLHLLKKATGNRLQAINAGLMIGTYGQMIGRVLV